MRFRKKPVVIDAVQYVGQPDEELGLTRCGCDAGKGLACSGCGKPLIETLEGDMAVSPNDWIITGVKGERYPCKPDIFAATYEPAE